MMLAHVITAPDFPLSFENEEESRSGRLGQEELETLRIDAVRSIWRYREARKASHERAS